MHRLSLAAIVLTAMLGTSCDSTPTSPSNVNITGRWGGTTCWPNRPNVCAILFDISQSGSSLTGTWGTTGNHGTVTGTVSGSIVSLVMRSTAFPSAAERPLTLTYSAIPERLSGAYTDQSTILITR